MEVRRIADQLRRSLNGPAWHGPSVLEILSDVTGDEAKARPLAPTHSIAEIVVHITAWVDAVRRGLDGAVVALDGPADWPPPGEWSQDVEALRTAVDALATRVEGMSDDELRHKVRSADAEYSRYVLLHGVTQHNLYHAGQLALLKKALKG